MELKKNLWKRTFYINTCIILNLFDLILVIAVIALKTSIEITCIDLYWTCTAIAYYSIDKFLR